LTATAASVRCRTPSRLTPSWTLTSTASPFKRRASRSTPPRRAERSPEEQARRFAERAEEQQTAALAEEFPYLAEVVAGHVAKVGYDFRAAFEYGLDLILDALEKRRDTA
jgi:hypothetical protein